MRKPRIECGTRPRGRFPGRGAPGGVAGSAGGARFYRNAADAKRPRAAPQKDFYRNQAARALDKLRAAGVADVVLAHLLELWGLRRCGDAARLGPLLLGDE